MSWAASIGKECLGIFCIIGPANICCLIYPTPSQESNFPFSFVSGFSLKKFKILYRALNMKIHTFSLSTYSSGNHRNVIPSAKSILNAFILSSWGSFPNIILPRWSQTYSCHHSLLSYIEVAVTSERPHSSLHTSSLRIIAVVSKCTFFNSMSCNEVSSDEDGHMQSLKSKERVYPWGKFKHQYKSSVVEDIPYSLFTSINICLI